MQPEHHPLPRSSTATATRHRPRIQRRWVAGLAAAASLSLALGACGGSSEGTSSGTPDGAEAASTTVAAGDGGSASPDATTTTGTGTDLDLCAEVTKEDVAAILPEADLVAAAPREGLTAPSCGYAVEIGGAGTSMTADVVSIIWNDPSYFDGQKELQTDEVDLSGIGADAFSIDDGGIILVRGETGTFEITRGVELTSGGAPASDAQMTAIAELVGGL
jgi:hypothetical protein